VLGVSEWLNDGKEDVDGCNDGRKDGSPLGNAEGFAEGRDEGREEGEEEGEEELCTEGGLEEVGRTECILEGLNEG